MLIRRIYKLQTQIFSAKNILLLHVSTKREHCRLKSYEELGNYPKPKRIKY